MHGNGVQGGPSLLGGAVQRPPGRGGGTPGWGGVGVVRLGDAAPALPGPHPAGSPIPGASRSSPPAGPSPMSAFGARPCPPPPPSPARSRATGCSLRAAAARPAPAAGGETGRTAAPIRAPRRSPPGFFGLEPPGPPGGRAGRERGGAPAALHGQGL